MPVISAVVVSYRSAALAVRALESLRKDAASSGLTLETIAVVNSADGSEARALEAAAGRVLVPGRNLGYAGGLNAGAKAASGDVLVLSNPDVLVREGALAALAAAARTGLAAAGPAFFLDEGETIHMPPAEEPHPFALARRRLAGQPAAFRRGLRRAFAAADAVARGETRAVGALSGALVAVSRATLDRVGPFDEAYALYYEENDWQRRLRRSGGTLSVRRRRARRPRLQPERAPRAARRRVVRGVRAPVLHGALRCRAAPPRSTRSRAHAPRAAADPAARKTAPSGSPRPPPSPSRRSRTFPRSRSCRARRRARGARRRTCAPASAREPWYARAVDPGTLEVVAEAAIG